MVFEFIDFLFFIALVIYFFVMTIPLLLIRVMTGKAYLTKFADEFTDWYIEKYVRSKE